MRPQYEQFAKRMRALLWDLLEENPAIDIHDITIRVNDPDHFVEKCHRKRDKYTNPLEDMTDIVGGVNP